jgi:hypothetical protein
MMKSNRRGIAALHDYSMILASLLYARIAVF